MITIWSWFQTYTWGFT